MTTQEYQTIRDACTAKKTAASAVDDHVAYAAAVKEEAAAWEAMQIAAAMAGEDMS